MKVRMGALIAVLLLVIAVVPAAAHGGSQDSCGDRFTYTKSSDFNDNRVDINFSNGDETITVTAKSGYILVSVQLDVENDGHSGYWTYNLSSGVAFNPSPGGDIDSARVVVEKDCPYQLCDQTVTLAPTTVWGAWSPWVFDQNSGLETRYRDGVETTLIVDAFNQQHVCDSRERPVHEDEEQKPGYADWGFVPTQACVEGWDYEVIDPGHGAVFSLDSGAMSGSWDDLYGPEDNSAQVPTGTMTWPSGYSETMTADVIVKDSDCIQARLVIPMMYLYTSGAGFYTNPDGGVVNTCSIVSDLGPAGQERIISLCASVPVDINLTCAKPVWQMNPGDFRGYWGCDRAQRAFGEIRLPLFSSDGGGGKGTLFHVWMLHQAHKEGDWGG